MDPGDSTETARRVRAAMAYGKLQRKEAAKIMGTTPGTLDRIIGTKGTDTKAATWEQLRRLAEHVGLAPEWFSADLDHLPAIVPAGGVVFVRPTAETPEEAREREAAALAARAQQQRAHHEGAPDTTTAPTHQKGQEQ